MYMSACICPQALTGIATVRTIIGDNVEDLKLLASWTIISSLTSRDLTYKASHHVGTIHWGVVVVAGKQFCY